MQSFYVLGLGACLPMHDTQRPQQLEFLNTRTLRGFFSWGIHGKYLKLPMGTFVNGCCQHTNMMPRRATFSKLFPLLQGYTTWLILIIYNHYPVTVWSTGLDNATSPSGKRYNPPKQWLLKLTLACLFNRLFSVP